MKRFLNTYIQISSLRLNYKIRFCPSTQASLTPPTNTPPPPPPHLLPPYSPFLLSEVQHSGTPLRQCGWQHQDGSSTWNLFHIRKIGKVVLKRLERLFKAQIHGHLWLMNATEKSKMKGKPGKKFYAESEAIVIFSHQFHVWYAQMLCTRIKQSENWLCQNSSRLKFLLSVCTYTHTYTQHTHTCMHVHTHTHTHHMRVHTHTHTYTTPYTQKNTTHTRAHTHTQTHTHNTPQHTHKAEGTDGAISGYCRKWLQKDYLNSFCFQPNFIWHEFVSSGFQNTSLKYFFF